MKENAKSMRQALVAWLLTLVLAIGGVSLVPVSKAVADDVAAGSVAVQSISRSDSNVKLKKSYTETMKGYNKKDKVTFKMTTKKAVKKRKFEGDALSDGYTQNYYPVTLKKFKSSRKAADVPMYVTFKDSRMDSVLEWPEGIVTKIAPKAFKSSKATKLTVDSTKLTKKGVKNCLKDSRITTVIVPKSCLKKYKKYFTETNCGKAVTIKSYNDKNITIGEVSMESDALLDTLFGDLDEDEEDDWDLL